MITLKVHEFGWIKGPADDPADQCAHGSVEFRVNETTFVKPSDGKWTVSAAALYLLRTLTLNHLPEDSVTEGNLLFPHCGFSVWPVEEKFKVQCLGCPNGVDVNVSHKEGMIILSSEQGTEKVSELEWRHAVLGFVTQVRDFYNNSSPKQPIKDGLDRRGWDVFWQEWEQRVTDAQ